jgi:hypothetical protein
MANAVRKATSPPRKRSQAENGYYDQHHQTDEAIEMINQLRNAAHSARSQIRRDEEHPQAHCSE